MADSVHPSGERGDKAPRMSAAERPHLDKMPPFEWMYWRALDLGEIALAQAIDMLISNRRAAMEDARWQGSRRLEVQADAERYRWLKQANPAVVCQIAWSARAACEFTEPDACVDAARAGTAPMRGALPEGAADE